MSTSIQSHEPIGGAHRDDACECLGVPQSWVTSHSASPAPSWVQRKEEGWVQAVGPWKRGLERGGCVNRGAGPSLFALEAADNNEEVGAWVLSWPRGEASQVLAS